MDLCGEEGQRRGGYRKHATRLAHIGKGCFDEVWDPRDIEMRRRLPFLLYIYLPQHSVEVLMFLCITP